MPEIKSRIKELKYVRAGTLIPNPKNWRKHPQNQIDALEHSLTSLGIVNTIIVRQTEQGYEIIDGHMRAAMDPEQRVPILVTDLTEREAKQALVTLDPMSELAITDQEILDQLLKELEDTADLEAELLDADKELPPLTQHINELGVRPKPEDQIPGVMEASGIRDWKPHTKEVDFFCTQILYFATEAEWKTFRALMEQQYGDAYNWDNDRIYIGGKPSLTTEKDRALVSDGVS